jgi:DNA-binding NtrC family response regulator
MAKILIIDDDESNRESLDMYLTEEGEDVVTAGTGERGVVQYREHRPDVVILDIRLPDIDGFTVLKRLKELNDDVKVIMITAYHDEHTIKRAMDLGAFAYVKKPIDLSDLESVIGRSLAHVPNHGSRQGDVRPLSSVVKS